MKNFIERLIRNEAAVSSIEYALLGGLIAVVILVSVTAVGSQLLSLFNLVSSKVVGAIS